jgi:hypothetical protein
MYDCWAKAYVVKKSQRLLLLLLVARAELMAYASGGGGTRRRRARERYGLEKCVFAAKLRRRLKSATLRFSSRIPLHNE